MYEGLLPNENAFVARFQRFSFAVLPFPGALPRAVFLCAFGAWVAMGMHLERLRVWAIAALPTLRPCRCSCPVQDSAVARARFWRMPCRDDSFLRTGLRAMMRAYSTKDRAMPPTRLLVSLAALLLLAMCRPASAAPPAPGTVIVCPAEATPLTQFAAREVRHYVYLRTDTLLPISLGPRLRGEDGKGMGKGLAIILSVKDDALLRVEEGLRSAAIALGPQDYLLRTVPERGLFLVGGSDTAVLYAAYRFAEHLGVRFYLHGDVIPDRKIPFALPTLDETRRPLFALRGIQPFHDFPEGPDWWNLENYQAVVGQLPKMGMNFLGLHTYPLSEPTVWVGEKGDVNNDGTVKRAYATQYFNTAQNSGWGYHATKTADFACGASQLFEGDTFGADFLKDFTPAPGTPDQCAEVFNRTGALFHDAFSLARSLGIKTCIGTETPLRIPPYILEKSVSPDASVQAVGGQNANYAGSPIDDTDDDPLYQSVRYNLDAYRFKVPNGSYKVTLKFAEVAYDNPGARVFDVSVQGNKVIEKLDLFAKVGKNKVYDVVLPDIVVTDGTLNIDFGKVVELPAIAAIAIEGGGATIKVNCGGDTYKDYLADLGIAPDPETIRAAYEGIFTRIQKTHPLDYYWFWTPEGWTWSGTNEGEVNRTINDVLAAHDALKNTGAPFQLATCGWVLGPQFDRALMDNKLPKDISMSCINRDLGFEPVDEGFKKVDGRGKWAIPWVEDDPAMSIPQFWARRMRRDAQTAYQYGCNGLMGIFWRTRVIAPTLASLAKAGWDQQWPETVPPAGSYRVRDIRAGFPITTLYVDGKIRGTDDAPVYQTCRIDARRYSIAVPEGEYKVTLCFCEPQHGQKGKRVFDVLLQGMTVLADFDISKEAGGACRVWDKSFEGITAKNGRIEIAFEKKEDWPCISAIKVEGPAASVKINCGGGAWGEYAADAQPVSENPSGADFYADWALHEFGPEIAAEAGEIFASLDSVTPRPATWTTGPGAFFPDPRPWELAKDDYAFVDRFADLGDRVKGAGERDRYQYWLNNLQYLRAAGRMDCAWAASDKALHEASKMKDESAKREAARAKALPARVELIKATTEVCRHLLATASSPGEFGNIANLEGHTFPKMLGKPGEELAPLLGEALPPEAQMPMNYAGPTRLFVPAAPGCRRPGDALTVCAVVLSEAETAQVTLHWRVMGKGAFGAVPMTHAGRGVWTATLPGEVLGREDIECYVQTGTGDAGGTVWPATAPNINHVVVWLDSKL